MGGKITGKNSIEVTTPEGKKETINAKNLSLPRGQCLQIYPESLWMRKMWCHPLEHWSLMRFQAVCWLLVEESLVSKWEVFGTDWGPKSLWLSFWIVSYPESIRITLP